MQLFQGTTSNLIYIFNECDQRGRKQILDGGTQVNTRKLFFCKITVRFQILIL